MASVVENLSFGEVISSVVASLESGKDIKIEGFGTFSLVEKPERQGRNPRTGQPTTYKPTRRPKITFDKKFLERVYAGPSASETSTETTSGIAPVASPTTNPAPVAAPALTPVAAPAAPVLPPPIPAELLTASAPPIIWQIKAPDGSFIEVPSQDLSKWGVGANTPIYSAATGWKLAGSIPELVGLVQ